MAKHRLDTATRERISRMNREQRSRFLGPQVANERLAWRLKSRDHLAEREHAKAFRTPLHYRSLLRCPEVVFKNYGW